MMVKTVYHRKRKFREKCFSKENSFTNNMSTDIVC